MSCWGEMRTTWKEVIPERFLPAPVPVRHTELGPQIPKVQDVKKTDRFAGLFKGLALKNLIREIGFKKPIPYDTYCPSIKPQEVNKRVCKDCNIYHSSQAAAC